MNRMKDVGEFGLIERIQKKIGVIRHSTVLKGIGDDCAAVSLKKNEVQLMTSDILVDGVDFLSKKQKPIEIGKKLVNVNVSDIAAMGGVPQYALLNLSLPSATQWKWVNSFLDGVVKALKEQSIMLVGGDVSSSKEISGSLSLMGNVSKNKCIYRNGAKKGDLIFVTGLLGGSILGKHLTFSPRIKEVKKLLSSFTPTAMIDVSDGLLQDLGHITKQSRVGAAIFSDWIPVSKDAVTLSKKSRKKPIEHALTDGEDFELLFTASPKVLSKIPNLIGKIPVTCIGEVVDVKKGINVFPSPVDTRKIKISKKGYNHF